MKMPTMGMSFFTMVSKLHGDANHTIMHQFVDIGMGGMRWLIQHIEVPCKIKQVCKIAIIFLDFQRFINHFKCNYQMFIYSHDVCNHKFQTQKHPRVFGCHRLSKNGNHLHVNVLLLRIFKKKMDYHPPISC